MRIKNVRQGLHTLLHTQGLDGLLHLYKRLEKRGRALLLCLLCAEAGWLILVNAWLRLERAYAPKGNKNAFKHGHYAAEAIATRREIAKLLRDARALVNQVS